MRPVQHRRTFILAAGMLLGAQLVSAGEVPESVVAVRYLVTEQSPERIEAIVTNPFERSLRTLPRISGYSSNTGHGFVTVEIEFDGGATQQDVETLQRHIEQLRFGPDSVITSGTIVLARRSH
jgi:multidrug efflux pump subunit AcrB